MIILCLSQTCLKKIRISVLTVLGIFFMLINFVYTILTVKVNITIFDDDVAFF